MIYLQIPNIGDLSFDIMEMDSNYYYDGVDDIEDFIRLNFLKKTINERECLITAEYNMVGLSQLVLDYILDYQSVNDLLEAYSYPMTPWFFVAYELIPEGIEELPKFISQIIELFIEKGYVYRVNNLLDHEDTIMESVFYVIVDYKKYLTTETRKIIREELGKEVEEICNEYLLDFEVD